jgi:hypothetical protein
VGNFTKLQTSAFLSLHVHNGKAASQTDQRWKAILSDRSVQKGSSLEDDLSILAQLGLLRLEDPAHDRFETTTLKKTRLEMLQIIPEG